METHSSVLAWKIPWAEEPGRLQHGVTELDMTGSRETTNQNALGVVRKITTVPWTRVLVVEPEDDGSSSENTKW